MKEQSLFDSLEGRQFIALTTYRKSGATVMTPVWFVRQGDRLLVWTAKDSGKAKRLRNNPCVQLGASNHSGKLLGPTGEAMARFLPESEHASLKRAFQAKYGWQERLFTLLQKIQGHQYTYLEITSPGGLEQ